MTCGKFTEMNNLKSFRFKSLQKNIIFYFLNNLFFFNKRAVRFMLKIYRFTPKTTQVTTI